jgi:TPR repeat protein
MEKAIELYNSGQFGEAYPLFYSYATKDKNSEAQLYLGMMYEHGDGVHCDIEKAKNWYRKSARSRNPDAEFRLQSIDQKTNCRC